jgi:cob(I)alamin adenosyltransferase
MKVYTKTGDKGETGVIGRRISKDSSTITLIGNLDELNALIGVVITVSSDSYTKDLLTTIQSDIFAMGAIIANGKVKVNLKEQITLFENEIDRMNVELLPLENFILPAGTHLSAQIHLCRSVCRRVERSLVSFIRSKSIDSEKIENLSERELQLLEILKYLNRLSDLLFILARYANHIEGVADVKWEG